MDIRDIILKELMKIEDDDVALCLSSGVDSSALLFALLELNKNVHVYSFTLEDRESTDFKVAKSLANKYDLDFTPIYLPTNVDVIIKDLYTLARDFNASTKTDFECAWPFLYVYPKVKERYIVTGIPADGHFCLSKRGMIHYKDNIEEFRNIYFSKDNVGQLKQRQILANSFGKINIDPYYSSDIMIRLKGFSWDDINKPYQKMPIINMYPSEFNEIKIRKHTNFQLGDSGISEVFKQIITHDINKWGYKSVVGIYNQIIKEVRNDS